MAVFLIVGAPAAPQEANKNILIFLEDGLPDLIIQTGVPISKHLVLVETTDYQADGLDGEGNLLCFYFIDFVAGIKIYISPMAQDPINIAAEGNEDYMRYLLGVSRVVYESGGIGWLTRACTSGFNPAVTNKRKGIFTIN